MYSFISGITDTFDINFCPKCGAEISECFGDGTGRCDNCEFRFGVVEYDPDDTENVAAEGIYE